jgi:hypothetical protein
MMACCYMPQRALPPSPFAVFGFHRYWGCYWWCISDHGLVNTFLTGAGSGTLALISRAAQSTTGGPPRQRCLALLTARRLFRSSESRDVRSSARWPFMRDGLYTSQQAHRVHGLCWRLAGVSKEEVMLFVRNALKSPSPEIPPEGKGLSARHRWQGLLVVFHTALGIEQGQLQRISSVWKDLLICLQQGLGQVSWVPDGNARVAEIG